MIITSFQATFLVIRASVAPTPVSAVWRLTSTEAICRTSSALQTTPPVSASRHGPPCSSYVHSSNSCCCSPSACIARSKSCMWSAVDSRWTLPRTTAVDSRPSHRTWWRRTQRFRQPSKRTPPFHIRSSWDSQSSSFKDVRTTTTQQQRVQGLTGAVPRQPEALSLLFVR